MCVLNGARDIFTPRDYSPLHGVTPWFVRRNNRLFDFDEFYVSIIYIFSGINLKHRVLSGD